MQPSDLGEWQVASQARVGRHLRPDYDGRSHLPLPKGSVGRTSATGCSASYHSLPRPGNMVTATCIGLMRHDGKIQRGKNRLLPTACLASMQQHYLKHRLRHQIETDERRSHGTISVMKRSCPLCGIAVREAGRGLSHQRLTNRFRQLASRVNLYLNRLPQLIETYYWACHGWSRREIR
jgi:hypothetical protein